VKLSLPSSVSLASAARGMRTVVIPTLIDPAIDPARGRDGASARQHGNERAEDVEIPAARQDEVAPAKALAGPIGEDGGRPPCKEGRARGRGRAGSAEGRNEREVEGEADEERCDGS
jgi:hypothetical protein